MKNKMLKIFLGILIYILVFSSFPYIIQKDVSQDFKNKFDVNDFYKNDGSISYAGILRDNERSLIEKIRAIDNAKGKIKLGNYRFLMDESGKLIMASLLKAADRGVKIDIILDGNTLFMNAGKNDYYLALASHPNVDIMIYNPMSLIRPWSLMGRMHDKYMIVDEELIFVGGRNIADRFLKSTGNYTYDWDIVAYYEKRGKDDAISQLEAYFDYIYKNGKRNKAVEDALIFTSSRKKDEKISYLKSIYEHDKRNNPKNYRPISYKDQLTKVGRISLIANPTNIYSKEPLAFYQMTELMKNAKDRVIIHTPYFIGNKKMYEEFNKIADKSSTSLFTNSPKSAANTAGTADYILNEKKLRKTKAIILENERPHSYHGKGFIVDDDISAIGSFNWDMRSTYIDTELMLVVEGRSFNNIVKKEFDYYEEVATRLLDDGRRINESGKDISTISPIKKVLYKTLAILTYPFRFLF